MHQLVTRLGARRAHTACCLAHAALKLATPAVASPFTYLRAFVYVYTCICTYAQTGMADGRSRGAAATKDRKRGCCCWTPPWPARVSPSSTTPLVGTSISMPKTLHLYAPISYFLFSIAYLFLSISSLLFSICYLLFFISNLLSPIFYLLFYISYFLVCEQRGNA